MLRRLAVSVTMVLLAHGYAGAQAQDTAAARTPTLDAGQVATVVVQVPAPAELDSARYSLELDEGYRAFIPVEGSVERMGDLFFVPVTFSTPRQLPAGRLVAGHATVRVAGRAPIHRELAIRIRERRDVVFELGADEITVAPDAVTGVPFLARNRGNRADTLYVDIQAGEGWSLVSDGRVILEPGDSASGALRIAAPVNASPGDRQVVLVTARTAAGQQTRTVDLSVVSASGWLGDLAQVPSSVFVGQSLGTGSSPVVALTGGGKIGPDTEIRLDIRHSDDGIVDPALQRQVAGARLRAAVIRPGLRVEAGDVYGFETTLSGSLRQARGLRSSYDPAGPLSFRGIAALPMGFGGRADGGHILNGEAGLDTDYGQFDLLAGDLLHPTLGTAAETRTTGAGLRWTGGVGVHDARLEATVVRFSAADSIQRTGPAVNLEYQLSAEGVNGRIRLRRTPDAATGSGGQGNELSGSLSAALAPRRLYLVGWGYTTEQNLLGYASRTTSMAANLGLRGNIGPLQLQLGGTRSERATTTAVDSFDFARNTARAEAIYTRGSFSLQSNAELGTSRELGRHGAYRSMSAGVRWYGSGRWGWLRLQHTRRPGGVESTNLHTGGKLAVGPVELSGGVSTTLTGDLTTTSLWWSSEIQARRNLSLHLGASARPTVSAEDWTFSLGVSRRLNLPLPFARQPDVQGTVFNDANDNGALDPGEEPLSGVTLNLGHLEARSDDHGRFAFRDATGAPLRVRSRDLPMGYIVSPRAVLPARGQASIPLLQTATLTLQLFLDRDEDGAWDPAESPGHEVMVTLTDGRGRKRTATADTAGTIRFSGLPPAHYAVTARPASSARRGENPEVLLEIDLEPGAEVHDTLAVPLRRRTIRMGGDRGGFESFEDR